MEKGVYLPSKSIEESSCPPRVKWGVANRCEQTSLISGKQSGPVSNETDHWDRLTTSRIAWEQKDINFPEGH